MIYSNDIIYDYIYIYIHKVTSGGRGGGRFMLQDYELQVIFWIYVFIHIDIHKLS